MSRNGKARRTATHCANGHPWTAESTHVRPDGKSTECLICCRDREKRRRQRQSAERRQRRSTKPPVEARPVSTAEWWARLVAGPNSTYQQAMLEALAEYREWEARQAAKGRWKLKVNCWREVAA